MYEFYVICATIDLYCVFAYCVCIAYISVTHFRRRLKTLGQYSKTCLLYFYFFIFFYVRFIILTSPSTMKFKPVFRYSKPHRQTVTYGDCTRNIV